MAHDEGCSLAGAEAQRRIAAWAALIEDALTDREAIDDGFALHFAPHEGIAQELRRLAELEAECCADLTFDVRSGGDAVSMYVTGPWEETPWRMAMPAIRTA